MVRILPQRNINCMSLISRLFVRIFSRFIILFLSERERIVDIGFLDCWWFTKKAMIDHDICVEEWNENGTPRNSHEQLKPMW